MDGGDAVTPMDTPRDGHGLVSAQGKLFAVGGLDHQDHHLSSVECFDPSTRVWSNIAALSTPRRYLAVAVMGDKLYAIGGQDSHHRNLRVWSALICQSRAVSGPLWPR